MADIDKILDPDLYEPEVIELFKAQQGQIDALSKAVKAKDVAEAAKPRDAYDFDESSETPMPANYAHALKKLREREAAMSAPAVESVTEPTTEAAPPTSDTPVDTRTALSRPTGVSERPLSTEAQAVSNARDRMVDMGMDPIADGYNYDDEANAFPE